jgi:sugar lactone lactonase YvrE
MTERTFSTLATGGSFFEGPRWHDGRWWVSDFYRHTVSAIAPDGAAETIMAVEAQPSGLGWLPDGSLLVVSMTDHRVLRRATDGTTTVHAELAPHCGGPANDLVVAADGRAWVGNFGFDLLGGAAPRPAALVRVDPDGTTTVAARDLAFPNGSVVTPDGTMLVVGETMGARYTAFTITSGGVLTERRVWAEVPGVAPDGCTLDAEGHIWAADCFGSRVVRVAADRGVVDEIALPDGLGAYACMLGGDDGRTLLVCGAPDFDAARRRANHEAVLLTTTVDVPHAGLP